MSKNTSSSVYVQPQKILLLSNSLMVTHMENIRMYSYYTTTLPMESTKLQTLGTKINMKVLDHVMPREKRCGALDSCFGLVGPHQQSILQLLSLAPRVYKGYQEHSTCGSELMRFIPCHWYVLLTMPRHSWFGA